MSEAEVVDPAENIVEQEPAACWGEYEECDDCLNKCSVVDRCKAHTLAAPKPPTEPTPELTPPDEEMEGMTPHDCLVSSMQGRYDMTERMDGEVKVMNFTKEGVPVAQIRTVDGRYLFVTTKAKFQLEELESTRQATHIFQAILMI